MSATNSAASEVASHAITDLIGNWFLYGGSMFIELTLTLVSLMLVVNTTRAWLACRNFTRSNDPINLNKLKTIFLAATFFLRSVTDSVMLLTWEEVSFDTFMWMVTADRVLSIIAMLPFMAATYLLFRAGPAIEFQLLRQPIPTDLNANWRMLKTPLLTLSGIFTICMLVTIAKL
jgi:hypothetical protein